MWAISLAASWAGTRGISFTSKTGQGEYSYQGDQGENYANPHAVTSINSNPLTYDNNGNLLTFGNLTNTWDYNNRLIQTSQGATTTVSTYDPWGERLTYRVGASAPTTSAFAAKS